VHYLQVPPDFYIPDFDEDLQNPDERIDRKENFFLPFIPYIDLVP
jgi:histone deacetylase 1/2